MPITAAILLLGLALTGPVPRGSLRSAELTVALSDSTAAVTARYRLTQPDRPLSLTLIRWPGQHVEPGRDPSAPGIEWRFQPGLAWIVVPASAIDGGVARLSYRVTGSLERIPIPVPQLPAAPGAGAVTLTVRGLDAATRFHEGFPRLVSRTDGSAVARLDNVPSLLRPPPRAGAWSVARGMQALVLALVALSSIWWTLRLRREPR